MGPFIVFPWDVPGNYQGDVYRLYPVVVRKRQPNKDKKARHELFNNYQSPFDIERKLDLEDRLQ